MDNGMFMPPWCSVDDAPAVQQKLIGRDAVYRLVREGRISHIRLSQRRLLVRPNFLEELAEGGRTVESFDVADAGGGA